MQNFTTIKTSLADDGIFEITLSRPDKLNALNDTMLEELLCAFSYAKETSSVKGIFITGEGKAFCAGADINRLAKANALEGLAFARQGQHVFRSLETLGKPSLAAINGYAFGGGCELAMATSIRTAADKAQFGQPEVKLGIIPGYGGTQRLARLVGKGRAIDLCITGRVIDGKTAYDWGLVTLLTSGEDLLVKSRERLLMATQQAPLAVASCLQVIDEGFNLPLPQALELEALHFSAACATKDKTEGTSAFLEKRKAIFKGE
jgi:enoyl-CoA hydratase